MSTRVGNRGRKPYSVGKMGHMVAGRGTKGGGRWLIAKIVNQDGLIYNTIYIHTIHISAYNTDTLSFILGEIVLM